MFLNVSLFGTPFLPSTVPILDPQPPCSPPPAAPFQGVHGPHAPPRPPLHLPVVGHGRGERRIQPQGTAGNGPPSEPFLLSRSGAQA